MKETVSNLSEGKLPIELLEELLQFKGAENPGLITGPGIGLDAAVIDFNKAAGLVRDFYQSDSDLLVVKKTDPITFSTPDPGRSVININSNDIVCTGAIPLFFNATMIIPAGFDYQELLAIQKSMSLACQEQDIAITGGHTEISSSVNTPVIAGTMLGLVPRDYLVRGTIVEGDVIVMAGHAGLEGTHILLDVANGFFDQKFGKEMIEHARIVAGRLSVTKKALAINRKYKPAAMHDPTEGGVLGALYEFTHGSKAKLAVEPEAIPVMDITASICTELGIEPLQLISSGALLLATTEENAEKIASEFDNPDYPVKIIGTVTDDGPALPPPGPDHLIRGLAELEKLLKL